jgi:protein phosphatase
MSIELSWAARTDVGLRRKVNEDTLIAESPLFLVADGMGGHEAGDVASRRALDAFRHLIGQPAVSLDDVQAAFRNAVRDVSVIDATPAPGTTITGVALSQQGGSAYWVVLNIGDSRTYRLCGGLLEQISVDHSAVQELLDEGRLRPQDAAGHAERHVITKAVGAGSKAEPDYWLLPVNAGERLLICSDGLSREVTFELLQRVLLDEASPDAAATRLVHEALLHGGHDNVSVIVVDVVRVIDAMDEDDFPTVPPVTADAEVDTVPRSVLREIQGGDRDQVQPR